MRRVIDITLTAAYCQAYWEPADEAEASSNILNRAIREKVQERINKSPPGRFPRWIDATLIEHQIEILTNTKLYDEHFKAFFALLFPANFSQGREYVKFILGKCAVVRNTIYHTNPVSVRQVEQTICYTNDVIDSIKLNYSTLKMHESYNVPTIVGFDDSRGLRVLDGQIANDTMGKWIRLPDTYNLRPGDKMKFTVEVDSSFREDEYTIQWRLGAFDLVGEGASIVIEFRDEHVSESIGLNIEVKSNKSWHKYRDHDDSLRVSFRILPPI